MSENVEPSRCLLAACSSPNPPRFLCFFLLLRYSLVASLRHCASPPHPPPPPLSDRRSLSSRRSSFPSRGWSFARFLRRRLRPVRMQSHPRRRRRPGRGISGGCATVAAEAICAPAEVGQLRLYEEKKGARCGAFASRLVVVADSPLARLPCLVPRCDSNDGV